MAQARGAGGRPRPGAPQRRGVPRQPAQRRAQPRLGAALLQLLHLYRARVAALEGGAPPRPPHHITHTRRWFARARSGAARAQARDKEKEANGETSHRRTVRVELTRMPADADVEPRRPSVITSTTEEQRSLPRAAATASDRRKRTAQREDTAVVYNLANEPWLKYSWALVADRGFTAQRCTALKLESRVLFLETEQCAFPVPLGAMQRPATQLASTARLSDPCPELLQRITPPRGTHTRDTPCVDQMSAVHKTRTINWRQCARAREYDETHLRSDAFTDHAVCRLRYELAVASNSDRASGRLLFRLSRCKRAYPHDMLELVGVPLPESHKEVLVDGCPWESFLVCAIPTPMPAPLQARADQFLVTSKKNPKRPPARRSAAPHVVPGCACVGTAVGVN